MSIKTTNDIAKATKNAILSDICNTIYIKKSECNANNKILPYGFITEQIAGVNIVCPGITRHDVNNEFCRRKRQGAFKCVTTDITLTGEGNIVPPSKLAEVLTRLSQWEIRGALPVEEDLDIAVREEEELPLDEDAYESDFD